MIIMKTKSLVLAILLLSLSLLTFSGCGKKANQSDPAVNPVAGSNVSSEWNGAGKCYKKVPFDYQNTISGVWGSGKNEYAIANYYVNADCATFEIVNNDRKIIYTTPNGNLLDITGSNGCIWAAEAEPDSINGQAIVLKKLSAYGSLIRTVRLDDIITVTGYIEDMAADADNNVFILTDGKLFAMDDSGSLLSELTFKTGFPVELAVDAKGTVCAKVQSPAGKAVYSLDAKTGKTTKLMELGEYSIHNGDEDYYLYLSNHEGLWGLASPDSDTYEPVIIWSECGIDFVGLKDVFPLDNNNYFCMDDNGAHTLTPALPEEIVHKTTVTLACVSPLTINEAVSRFNSKNDSYWVIVRDYSQGGSVSRSDALNLLNTDIIAGKTPDLILFADMPISPYTEKGVMSDLYSFLDSDPDIDRDDFILLDKFETDGKLFYLAGHFGLELVYGRYSDFGDRDGWTIDEFMEKQNSLKDGQEVFPDMSREYFLEGVMRGYLQKAVDWKSGSCNFENGDFISILNAAASIDPNAKIDYAPFYMQTADELARGERVTSLGTLGSVYAIAETEREAGERLSIIGWPTIDGKCGTLLNIDYPIGICEASGNKDGAWAFVKYLLVRDPLDIPIYKDRLNEEIDSAINRTALTPNDPLITVGNHAPIMTRDDAARLFAFLNSIELVNEENDDIMNIVLEEANAFFAGDKSAEATAKIVQNRVGILMSERS